MNPAGSSRRGAYLAVLDGLGIYDYESEGRTFESFRARQFYRSP